MRYSRQYALPEVGEEGQKKISKAKVLLIGLGGLGCPAALYLAGAGVGRLGLVDADRVSLSNLHRQVLYSTQDVGRLKVEAGAQRLWDLNPTLQIESYPVFANASNCDALFADYDIIVDGSDSLATRALVSRASLRLGKPYVYGGIFRFEAQVAVFGPEGKPCYRCLFPDLPSASEVPSCAEAGVLGPLPGIVGSMQALEALKLILGIGQGFGQLLVFDALRMEAQTLRIPKRASCLHCSPAAKDEVEAWEILAETRQISDRAAAPGALQWIDVRSEEEFSAGAFPDAANLPLRQIREGKVSLAREGTYAVYCASGIRSREAQGLLTKAGFLVWNLEGGIQAQKEKGF